MQLPPTRPRLPLLPLLLCGVLGVSGCTSVAPADSPTPTAPTLRGALRGGQQPIAGATIQLFAAGTSGDGSAATPLLTQAVFSAEDGSFTLTGLFTCPYAGALVYLLATGGDAGIGGNNPALALMAAIGLCGSLSASTFLTVDEVTTVAAIMPIASAGFFTTPVAIGASPADASLLAAAFTSAAQLAEVASGTAPGSGIPIGTQVPVDLLNTLANLIAACVNSAGGKAGDGSLCGNLFALGSVPGLVTPSDTIGLLAAMALQPSANTAALFATLPAQPVFAPALTSAPASFAAGLIPTAGIAVSTPALTFSATYVGAVSAAQSITLLNTASQPIPLSTPALAGFASADFGLLSDCPAALAAQSTCTVWVTFAPFTFGTRVAALDLTATTGQNLFVPLLGTSIANPPATFAYALDDSTVFMGASIVQMWPMPLHNAGIYGQTTPQMVARFAHDVLGHGYTRVVILGGSNDITGGLDLESVTLPDLEAMGQMAHTAGMEVVLSQLPPLTLHGISYNPQVVLADAAIRQLATRQGWLCVDYYTPMSGHPEYFLDGEHPNAAGYAVMEAALAKNVTR